MCELCELKVKTKVYYEDDYFIVLDCKDCKVPMIVSKRHTTELNQEEIIDLMWLFNKLWIDYGQEFTSSIDQNRRKVLDHWHCHIR